MDLPNPMKILYNLRYLHAICFKFGETFLTSITKSVLEAKASIFSKIKKIYFYIAVGFWCLLSLL